VIGPVVLNYMRDYQLGRGLPPEQVYNQTMYILVGMLVVGLICNWLVRPLNPKWFMTAEELAQEKQLAHEKVNAVSVATITPISSTPKPVSASSRLLLVLAWAAVGLPLAWGVYRTSLTAAKFF
jgi:hypothetical protein